MISTCRGGYRQIYAIVWCRVGELWFISIQGRVLELSERKQNPHGNFSAKLLNRDNLLQKKVFAQAKSSSSMDEMDLSLKSELNCIHQKGYAAWKNHVQPCLIEPPSALHSTAPPLPKFCHNGGHPCVGSNWRRRDYGLGLVTYLKTPR